MITAKLKYKNGEGAGFSPCAYGRCFCWLRQMGHLCWHLQVVSVSGVIYSSKDWDENIDWKNIK